MGGEASQSPPHGAARLWTDLPPRGLSPRSPAVPE
ncbi:MAG: hypothetical protein FD152_2376 [Xanthobacteraceae bacterium]|nr:MAG: hypothetical protein FD152_2376 [Xanthobacteraceae bacterium]